MESTSRNALRTQGANLTPRSAAQQKNLADNRADPRRRKGLRGEGPSRFRQRLPPPRRRGNPSRSSLWKIRDEARG